jgi:hypothetical protein
VPIVVSIYNKQETSRDEQSNGSRLLDEQSPQLSLKDHMYLISYIVAIWISFMVYKELYIFQLRNGNEICGFEQLIVGNIFNSVAHKYCSLCF